MKAAAFLLLLASPALAQHKPVAPPVCLTALPNVSTCEPTMRPGTICAWPSTAHVMALPEFDGVTWLPTGRTGRVVAIIEGPVLVPLLPGALRTLYEVAVYEGWMACTRDGVVTANWGKSEDVVLTKLFCAP